MTQPAMTAKDLEAQARKAGLTVRRTNWGTIVEGPAGWLPIVLPRGNHELPKGLVRMVLKLFASRLRK